MRVDRRIRFEYATCGRGNFLIWKEKVADSKISGYVWTGPNTNTLHEQYFNFHGNAAVVQAPLFSRDVLRKPVFSVYRY